MNSFDKLVKIVDALKVKYEYGGNLHITFNEHTTNYETVESCLSHEWYDNPTDDGVEARKKRCIAVDKIVDVHIFPVWGHTSVHCFSDNIEDASAIMIENLKHYSQEVKSLVEEVLSGC
jgi:hypothetical protein